MTKDYILGGLYGQALGDAWGMPAYFDPQQTWERYGWIETFLAAPDDHEVHAGLPAGRITDDSEQAFSLARAYLDAGAVTIDASVSAIVEWYDRTGGDQSRYVGPSTRRGVQALKRGEDPRITGRMGDTNGAAMRVSVVGLLCAGDPMAAIEASEISALPTHGTNVAISGAAAVAASVAVACQPHATLDAVIAAGMMGAELGRQRGVRWLGASVTRKIEQAVAIARKGGDPLMRCWELYDSVGASLAITEVVGTAFGVLTLANGDPALTAKYAAAVSGDADTVAAIACAIAGTLRGFDAIPGWAVKALDADPVFQGYGVRALGDGIAAFPGRSRA
jgi:ADP-ribosylglycohydrolase